MGLEREKIIRANRPRLLLKRPKLFRIFKESRGHFGL
jgi:hypothetical protein